MKWSGSDAYAARKGSYHQFPGQFNHWTQSRPYAAASGYAECQFSWGGSTPRDQPELECAYVS